MTDRKQRILVVDDEPEIVSVLMHFLSGKGYDVEGAYDGEQALAKMERKGADLVLMDIMMPRVSGDQAARIIKQKYPASKLIVVTAYPAEGGTLCKENIPEALFIKPVQLQELYRQITQLLPADDVCQLARIARTKVPALMLKARVLFIEPSPEIYRLLNARFKLTNFIDQNYSFDVACCEREAVMKIVDLKPNIIVLDAAYFRKPDAQMSKCVEQLIKSEVEIIVYGLSRALTSSARQEKFSRAIKRICLKRRFLEVKWVEI
jgi:CheY-like chemotaxis protein